MFNQIEVYARLLRLPFVLVFTIVGTLTIIKQVDGWQQTFLIWTLNPLLIATGIIEWLAIYRLKPKK